MDGLRRLHGPVFGPLRRESERKWQLEDRDYVPRRRRRKSDLPPSPAAIIHNIPLGQKPLAAMEVAGAMKV